MGRAAHLMIHEITIALVTGRQMSGDPIFGEQSALPARVESANELVIDDEGNEVRAGHVIVTEAVIDRKARLWLPGDDTSSTSDARRIIATAEASTTDGYVLYETRL